MGGDSAPSLSLICLCSQQPPETPVPAHRPPEEDGEEEEREDDDEDEGWEDVSEDITEEEEEEEEFDEEEECPKEQEAPAVPDHQPGEAEPARKPTCEQADPAPARPQESLSPVPVEPSSPFSPTGDHQPVSDWGEEMELNFPSTAHSAGEAWPFGNV